jgi:hypothetical protein
MEHPENKPNGVGLEPILDKYFKNEFQISPFSSKFLPVDHFSISL